MALSREEKEALSDHYRNMDLYDPTKDPDQEVSTFEPAGMCGGGMEKGYAEGGNVADDFSVSTGADTLNGLDAPAPAPILTDTGTTMAGDMLRNPPAPRPLEISPENFHPSIIPPGAPPAAPKVAPAAPRLPLPGRSAPPAAREAPIDGKLDPSEYDQLVKYLQPGLGQRLGEGAMSGLAGLADAIEMGVARTGNPGFQKGVDERTQNNRQNLINAMRAKYETGFKGAELGQKGQEIKETGRHNKAAETIGEKEAEAKIEEAKAAQQLNALEGMGRLSESGGITGRVLGQPTQAQEAINALAERAGLAGHAKVPTVTTKAQYDALPKGAHYQDSKGKEGIKK